MAAKIIDVGNGYSVQFQQRQRGEETPYWVGTILKGKQTVGTFNNSGRGGSTHITPPALERALEEMVDEADPVAGPGIMERANLVLHFAELKGYKRGFANYTMKEMVTAWLKP
jgi:hypothetical protein